MAPPPTVVAPTVTVPFSFAQDLGIWTSGFTNYTLGQESAIAFSSALRPVETGGVSGFVITATNASGRVFPYVQRVVTGLVPDRLYRLEARLDVATNATTNCAAAAGIATGTARVVIVRQAPANTVDRGSVTANFDAATSSMPPSTNSAILGPLASTSNPCTGGMFTARTFVTNASGPFATSDSEGRLWVVFGVDLTTQGTSTVQYRAGELRFVPI